MKVNKLNNFCEFWTVNMIFFNYFYFQGSSFVNLGNQVQYSIPGQMVFSQVSVHNSLWEIEQARLQSEKNADVKILSKPCFSLFLYNWLEKQSHPERIRRQYRWPKTSQIKEILTFWERLQYTLLVEIRLDKISIVIVKSWG